MRLQSVSSRLGAVWVRQGFRIFFMRPMAFAALFAVFMFAVFALTLLPFVGALIVLASLPLVSLGFMIATRNVLDGGLPNPRVFVDPLRSGPAKVRAMVLLGVTYAAATYAVMWLSDLVDGGAFEALMESLPAAPNAAESVAANLVTPGLALGLVLRFGLAGLLALPFWHAPALVHWAGHGFAKSLFSSTVACWRNRAAFIVYSLTWMALIVTCGVIGSVAFSLVGAPQLFAVIAVPLSLFFTTVFYVSLYFTFADCFVAGDSPLRLVA